MADKADNDWKKRLGMVYSTNPDYEYNTGEEGETETPSPHEQDLKVMIERKGRKGKTVTIVAGFRGKNEDMEALGKILRHKCGTGGSVKDDEIIIQGDFRDRIISLLKDNGYRAKRSGG